MAPVNRLPWAGVVSAPKLNTVGGCIPVTGTAENAVNAGGAVGFELMLDIAVSSGPSFLLNGEVGLLCSCGISTDAGGGSRNSRLDGALDVKVGIGTTDRVETGANCDARVGGAEVTSSGAANAPETGATGGAKRLSATVGIFSSFPKKTKASAFRDAEIAEVRVAIGLNGERWVSKLGSGGARLGTA